jgi:hypothetical protein
MTDFELMDRAILSGLCVALRSLPGQEAFKQVYNDIEQGLEVVSSTLLQAGVRCQ